MVTLQEIKDQINKYLYLSDTDVIDIVLATVMANRIPGDSISLYLVGPSASAKTELLNCLSDYGHIENISKITAHTLLSGYQDKNKKGEDHSMLTRLQKEDRNILIFKDFTTIISMRREDRAEFMSQLREMADGKITAHWGNDQCVILKAKFGVIAACTTAIDEFSAGNAVLGERFLKYRISAESAYLIARLGMEVDLNKDIIRNETSRAVKIFLDQFDSDVIFGKIPLLDSELIEKTVALCILGAHLRSPIIRDEKGIQMSEVDHEGPGRLISSVRKFIVALAMIRGMSVADASLFLLVKKLIKDTMPRYRLSILRTIYLSHDNVNLIGLMRELNIDKYTATKNCDDLVSLCIINKYTTPRITTTYTLKDSYIDLINKSEIFVMDKI